MLDGNAVRSVLTWDEERDAVGDALGRGAGEHSAVPALSVVDAQSVLPLPLVGGDRPPCNKPQNIPFIRLWATNVSISNVSIIV